MERLPDIPTERPSPGAPPLVRAAVREGAVRPVSAAAVRAQSSRTTAERHAAGRAAAAPTQ